MAHQIMMRLNRIMIWCFLFEHDLFGKPVSTFPDHALQRFPVISDHSVIQYDRNAP